MSRLNSILNPGSPERTAREDTAAPPSNNNDNPPPSSSSSTPAEPPMEVASTYKHYINPATNEHDDHTGCPNSLRCLPDTNQRPQHTLPIILRSTILGAYKMRLTIRDIYAAMEAKYPYYRTAGITWKQSVRHHLSLNRLFERQERPVTEPGFGSYWTVNLEAPPGTKRPRKRGRTDEPEDEEDGPSSNKRSRISNEQDSVYGVQEEHKELEEYPPTTRLPGMTALFSTVPQSSSAYYMYSNGNGNASSSYAPLRPPPDSAGLPRLRALREDDYETDDDVSTIDRPYSVGAWKTPSPPYSSPNNTSQPGDECPETVYTVERMRAEMEGLRRQSAESLAERLRLADQLAEAHADMMRARSEARAAEKMLKEEEGIRREEEKLRREAESIARDLQRQLHELRMSHS